MSENIQMTAVQAPAMQAANVDILTTSRTASEMNGVVSEATEVSAAASDAISIANAASAGGDVGLSADVVNLTTTTTDIAVTGAAAGSAWSAAGKLTKGFYVLGAAAAVALVVTEIIGAVDRAETRDKLIKLATQMDVIIKKAETSLKDVVSNYGKLLDAGKTDIQKYNKMLVELRALEHSHALTGGGDFSTKAFDYLKESLSAVNIDNTTSFAGTSENVHDALDNAIDFIRAHATHDGPMASTISQIRSHMRKSSLTTLEDDDPFLQTVAIADSIPIEKVKMYNQFRVYVATLASMVAGFHEETRDLNAGTTGMPTRTPTFQPGTPDPDFDPHPSQFTIPVVRAAKQP